jgi:hypothetical protein
VPHGTATRKKKKRNKKRKKQKKEHHLFSINGSALRRDISNLEHQDSAMICQDIPSIIALRRIKYFHA